jgi:hypothetical protein
MAASQRLGRTLHGCTNRSLTLRSLRAKEKGVFPEVRNRSCKLKGNQEIPRRNCSKIKWIISKAGMAELADAADSKSAGA